MRKLLLLCTLLFGGALSAMAYFETGHKVQYGEGIFDVFNLGGDSAAVAFDAPGQDVVIPATITAYETGMGPNGTTDVARYSFKVVQVNAANAKSITIPGTVHTIAPGCFSSVMGSKTEVETITFAKGDTPLNFYPAFKSKSDEYSKLSVIDINRDIKCVDYAGSYLYMPVNGNNVSFILKIGADVESLKGPLFQGIIYPDGTTSKISKVEFANWANWYKNTEIDCIEGNPYRAGATIEAGGFTITTVTIPDDATEIPAYKNAGLKFEGELFLPSTLKKIGAYGFANQKDLYYIEFPEGLEEIGDNAFNGCETLSFESLPSTLKTIGVGAFAGCASQKEIILPEKLNSLGYGAFKDMTALEKAVLFCEIDSVPGALCMDCLNLTTLYLPQGTTVIGAFAFSGTRALEEVVLPEGLETICDKAFIRTYNDATPSRLTTINFPSTLKSIGVSAFEGQDLRFLVLNEGLEEIGEYAFEYCSNLRQITIPSTLTTIPKMAFYNCPIAHVVIPDYITSIAGGSFNNGYVGSIVEVGNGVTDIPSGSFGYPAVLKLGSGVKNYDVNAVLNYNDMKVIELNSKTPPTVSAAFPLTTEQAEKITVLVPDGAAASYERNPRWNIFDIIEQSKANAVVYVNGTPISEEARLQSGIAPSRIVRMKVSGTLADTDWRLIRENFASLISLDLSAITNTTIPDEALMNMSQLTELVLPSKITEIGSYAFEGCSLMDMPSIPESVTKIGYRAFANCSMLSISKLPDELVYAYDAFKNCTSLRTIVAGDKFMGSEPEGASSVFSGCTSLEFVDFSETPMTNISSDMFFGCSNLTTILLPETITRIGSGAFNGTALEQIQFPAGVTEIGSGAFYGTNLRTVNIPEGVTSVDGAVFGNCAKLVSVNFPSSMTTLGADAFSGTTTKVTGISCSAIEAPAAATGALESLSIKRCSLTVPQQSYRSYLNAPQWGRLANLLNRIVVEIPEDFDVTSIAEEEYQEMLQEEEWNLMLEAEEVEEPENQPAAVKARKAARAAELNGNNFTALFNGAQMATPDERKGTRIFINLKPGQILKAVFYNETDITSQLEGNSLVLPGKSTGNLRIVAGSSSLEDAVVEGVVSGFCTAYDTMGRVVFSGDRADLEGAVAPGVYIVRSGDATEKVLVK